jgi:DNA helicase II / ATP-dependent DNA helicase PcrA
MNQTYQDKQASLTKIFDNLNSRQTEAVQSVEGETLVIAGAGSGKTAVLTRRCAYLITQGVVPGSILSLTFTNKAAQEMNHRIRQLLQEVGIYVPFVPSWSNDYLSSPLFCTFHSLGVKLLREFGTNIDLKKEFSILDSDDQLKLIRECQKELNIDPKVMQPSYVSHFISQCKQELLTATQSNEVSKDFLPAFHQVYARYENKCKQNNVVDFDDLILKPYLIIRDFGEVQETLHNRWKHIQVDEFQDINFAQFELVSLLYK